MEKLVLLLSPFAPHIAEELWQILGHDNSLAYETWPTYDESLLVEAEVEIPIQINGKVRAKIKVPADADKTAIEDLARSDPRACEFLDGKQVIKTIVVPGRMVNFVVKG
jgi:leucyl-tRNA synthetase